MKKKVRADQLLFEKLSLDSRNKAQAYIMAGQAEFYDLKSQSWKKISKPGDSFEHSVLLRVKASQDVGRGAQKLRRAFEKWPFLKEALQARPQNECLDVGASTGGFTQVLLENGASKVYALDVGTHQLHERLRADPRVISLEKCHVLRLEEGFWSRQGAKGSFDMIVTDLSFISLQKIVPVVKEWLGSRAFWVLLLKPQFEVGPKKAPKGVVRDPTIHEEVREEFQGFICDQKTLEWKGWTESPILGQEGNREFLVCLQNK